MALLILWIDLPENISLKFNIGQLKVDTRINPLSIDANILGISIKKDFRTHLGLDLQGGSSLVFEADTRKVSKDNLQDALASLRDVIERRVNLFGVSEPIVQTLKSGNIYRISVDLPGINNVNEAVRLIGETAQLTFREEGGDYDPKIATISPIFKLNKDTGLTGKDIKKASVTFNSQDGKPEVALMFNSEGGKKFAEITQRNINKQVGIFLDYYPISAPVVKTAIIDGNAVIEGNFTLDEAKKLAIAINSGALPLPIKLVEQKNIGPTLGVIEVKKSMTAGIVGLLMVLIFMIIYYGRL